MKFPLLEEMPKTKDMIEVFGGYNHNEKIPEKDFYDMKNMSTRLYPILAPRVKRNKHEISNNTTKKINGIIAKDTLCCVVGSDVYIGNKKISGLALTDTPKQLVSMGAYLVVFPDKKYINTKDFTDYGSLEATYTSNAAVRYEMCGLDGVSYSNAIISNTEPKNPVNGQLWIDTAQKVHSLKQYSASSSVWNGIATTYVKISSPNIAMNFKQWDGVNITGILSNIGQIAEYNGKISLLYEVHRDVQGNGAGDYIIIVGFLDTPKTQNTTETGNTPITITRTVPKMDFVIESENRLWGCRYGINNENKSVNEIYACKLGDFRNWNCFQGTAQDSYMVSCGTDGQFTGAIAYLGHPIFFKENCFHKVFGSFPAQYQVQTTACRGVQKGAGKSLAIVNERLYYKSRTGICMYDGSLPIEISNVLGNVLYNRLDETNSDYLRNGAVAGVLKNKYYISMSNEQNSDNEWEIFVYDTATNIWMKEDNLQFLQTCTIDDKLYVVDKKNPTILTVIENDIEQFLGEITSTDSWSVETGKLGLSLPNQKYISSVVVRFEITQGTLNFDIEYNSSGKWENAFTITQNTLKSFSIPIRVKRCDHFRLRLNGSGDVKIFSISKTIEHGSEI